MNVTGKETEERPKAPEKVRDLRAKAERLLARRSRDLRKIPPGDVESLFHELELHQIELEMQNDELRRAQEEIEERGNRFLNLFDFAPIPYFTFDQKGTIIEVNFKGAELLGLERSALIGRSFAFFVVPGDRHTFSKYRSDILRQASRERCELKVERKDGTVLDVVMESIADKDSKSNASRVLSALWDVTELRAKDEKIRAEHAFREAIENSIRLGVVGFDEEGRHIYANPAFCQMVGWSQGELIGAKPPFPYWPEEEEKAITEAFLEVFSRQKPAPRYELRFQHRRGRRFDALVIFSELIDPWGKPLGWLASVGDITERKKKEEEVRRLNEELEEKVQQRTEQIGKLNEDLAGKIQDLQKANKELETLSASAAHELKNYLIVIDLIGKRLIKKYEERMDAKGKEYLGTLQSASVKLNEVMEDLFQLSRSSQKPMKMEKVDLSGMAEEIVGQLRDFQQERQVDFRLEEGLLVRGDSRLFKIALENLLGNAWKFTGKRPRARIEFGSEDRGGQRLYFIRDNGCGFDRKFLHLLFMPFQRLHSQEEFPGTGLGLTTVRRIIERHGGRIWAESSPGEGATFYFTLEQ